MSNIGEIEPESVSALMSQLESFVPSRLTLVDNIAKGNNLAPRLRAIVEDVEARTLDFCRNTDSSMASLVRLASQGRQLGILSREALGRIIAVVKRSAEDADEFVTALYRLQNEVRRIVPKRDPQRPEFLLLTKRLVQAGIHAQHAIRFWMGRLMYLDEAEVPASGPLAEKVLTHQAALQEALGLPEAPKARAAVWDDELHVVLEVPVPPEIWRDAARKVQIRHQLTRRLWEKDPGLLGGVVYLFQPAE